LTDWRYVSNPSHPLLVFRSSPEFHTTEPALGGVSSTSNNLPCGSFPFDVFPAPGSHSSRGYQPSSTMPSQRFSRSQGLTPPGTCRPCFMPVPPLGFHPPGYLPPAEPHALSDAVALLWLPVLLVAAPSRLLPRPSRVEPLNANGIFVDAAPWRQAALQGLAPRERPFLQASGLDQSGGRDPHGLSPP
jgi:hypothetical protein